MQLFLGDKKIDFELKIDRRSRSIRLAVYPDGRVRISRPPLVRLAEAERFLNEKAGWILSRLRHFQENPQPILASRDRRDYLMRKETARKLVGSRLEHFNRHYDFRWSKIAIRSQKTRWGSCSRQGSLSFNYRLLDLEPEVCDYVIVHELCHLKEFNHSRRFWNLVAQTVPDHRGLRRKLKMTAA